MFQRLQGKLCLVQGASRGLGLEYVRQLLEIKDTRVVATCREPQRADGLLSLQKQHSKDRFEVVRLDVCSESSIQSAGHTVSKFLPHLDVLINVAGVLHIPGKMAPETSLQKLDPDSMMLSFQTNAIGPMLVCKALVPLLLAAQTHGSATPDAPAVIANMSARVGSITDNRLGGWYAYRGSKAALNQMTRTLTLELQRRKHRVACVLLHPGTVDTDLTLPYQRNVDPEKLFTRERGVKQLLEIINKVTMADTGKFLAWDGKEIPW